MFEVPLGYGTSAGVASSLPGFQPFKIANANSKRISLTLFSDNGLGSFLWFMGRRSTPAMVNQVVKQQGLQVFTGGGQIALSYFYWDYGPLIQQEIWCEATAGRQFGYSDVYQNCPQALNLPKEYQERTLTLQMWAANTNTAPTPMQILGGNSQRVALLSRQAGGGIDPYWFFNSGGGAEVVLSDGRNPFTPYWYNDIGDLIKEPVSVNARMAGSFGVEFAEILMT